MQLGRVFQFYAYIQWPWLADWSDCPAELAGTETGFWRIGLTL